MISVDSGVKFFTDSKALFRNGASCVASSGTEGQDYILNFDKGFSWASSGSNDSTTETLTITLNATQPVDRLFMINHNFKDFRITYNGGNEFSNVKTVEFWGYGEFVDEDGNNFTDENGNKFASDALNDCDAAFNITANNIDIIGYNKNTSYFEFDSVDISTIEISINNTQVVDAEKTLTIFSVNEEIGTFSNHGLDKNNPSIDHNIRSYNNILNKPFIRKGIETFSCSLRCAYVSSQEDVDLLEELIQREDNFLVWLCGGKAGTEYFSVNAKPYRLEDVYRVQNSRGSSPTFYQNIYTSGYSNSLNLVEVA